MKTNFSMSWKPAQSKVPSPIQQTKRLGQPSSQFPVPFIDSPELAAMLDLTASAASAYLAFGLQKAGNKWSTFWWIASAATGIKLLHDLSRF